MERKKMQRKESKKTKVQEGKRMKGEERKGKERNTCVGLVDDWWRLNLHYKQTVGAI